MLKLSYSEIQLRLWNLNNTEQQFEVLKRKILSCLRHNKT